MGSISSEALAKGGRGRIVVLSAQSGCSLARGRPRAGGQLEAAFPIRELSKRLGKCTTSELCLGESHKAPSVLPMVQ